MVVHEREATSEEEIAVTADGNAGPWRVCFRVSRGQILRPSVVVKVSYFTVNHMSLVGTQFEWQRGPAVGGDVHADASELGELGAGSKRVLLFIWGAGGAGGS